MHNGIGLFPQTSKLLFPRSAAALLRGEQFVETALLFRRTQGNHGTVSDYRTFCYYTAVHQVTAAAATEHSHALKRL